MWDQKLMLHLALAAGFLISLIILRNPLSPTANRLLTQAITDRDLYELRMNDMKRAGNMGVVTRQNRVPSAPQPQQ